MNSHYRLSDFSRKADNIAVRLPFADNLAYTVGQAYGGPLTTHNSIEAQYALDINMPIHSKVVAVRAGVVVDYEFSYNNAGKIKANEKIKQITS